MEDDIEGDLVDDNNTSYLNRNIVVSLDDKYEVIFEGTIDEILVISEESEVHDRFKI